MRLGNSNGNNRGKKYFMRGRDDQDLDVLYADKAEHFAQWFIKNIKATKNQLLYKSTFDDDVFNETYLRVYEILLFSGRKINDYASYFHRAYFTNLIQQATLGNRYLQLYDNYDVEEEEEAPLLDEMDVKIKSLGDDVLDYVYANYELHEFEIFKMYVNLKPAINYHALAKMTNKKYHTIQRMISTIIQDVKDNQQFIGRRKHLVGA